MIEKAALALSLALDRIANVPAEVWLGIGFTLASIATVPAVIAWRKRRHLKKYAEKMASGLIIFNVTMWSAILAAVEFVLLHGTTLTALGGFLPFWVSNGAAIMAGAILLREVSQALRKWWTDRQERKRFTLPDIDPASLEKLQRQFNPAGVPAQQLQPLEPQRANDLFS